MKKKLLVLGLCVALAAIAIAGASLAYFTDTKSATNTFTVGNVKIDLIESRFHREGNDNSGDTSIPDPTQTASGMKYVTDGHKAFTDAEIKADAANYSEYIAERGKNMVPGKNIAKSPYVVNTGANDAYVRIRVMIPSDANRDYWQARSGGVIESQFCTTAITSGEFMHGKRTDYPIIDASGKGYVDGNGVKYDVYTFIRTEPLKPGEMTEWNVWNYIGIADEATSANIQKAINKGAILVSEDGTMTASAGWTDIFIYPGYHYQLVDALITNFHLPQSTLLMLISALMGRENALDVYRQAVEERYRFFSFGDAMYIY